jgi:hypothetical protein
MFNIKVLATCFGCDQPSSGQIYIHLVDLHNEYMRAMGSHVVLQYSGNIYEAYSVSKYRFAVKKIE